LHNPKLRYTLHASHENESFYKDLFLATMTDQIIINADEAGQRLDRVLTARLGIVKRKLRKLCAQGRIRLNGRALLQGAPAQKEGSKVEILSADLDPTLLAEDIPLEVIYETERLMVVNKPPKMAMYPGLKRPAGTLANALRGLGRSLSTHAGPLRPGIVHRLDAGTSGALVVAKDDDIHRKLEKLFSERAIYKSYLALVHGCPGWQQIDCNAPLSSKRPGRKGMRVFSKGKVAKTSFTVIAQNKKYSLVEARPRTGRTHQIRVHLASLGFPLVGDTMYGGGNPEAYRAAKLGLTRPALHARKLQCKELCLDVVAPLASDFFQAMAKADLQTDEIRKELL
jgi:23S rRNA pseudouridine1911/1915/1917 synthase